MPKKAARTRQIETFLRFQGQRIREERERLGMTQVEFTRALGPGYPTSNGWLSEVERGHNGISTHDLARIAEVCGRPTDFFLDPSWTTFKSRWPRTLDDWTRLAGGDMSRANKHWRLDQELNADA